MITEGGSASCATCGKVTTSAVVTDEMTILCESCLDRLDLQIGLERLLPRLMELERSDPERALATLTEFQARNAERDHDRWLLRSVRDHRAHIFSQSGRYDDALHELRALAQDLPSPSVDFAQNQLGIAVVLEQAGRSREAIHELELGLAGFDEPDLSTPLGLLTAYARIAKREGWDVPDKYAPLFERAVAAIGLISSTDGASRSLTESILLAATKRREAQDRYIALLDEIQRDPDKRSDLIRQYQESEPVRYFREMASQELDD